MDGQRARRQKSGSPIGRIIDEALDMIQQSCYSLLMGYMFRFDNRVFEIMVIMINTVQHTMEMRFLLFGRLDITVGEIGPVEFECMLSSLLLLTGAYFGSECMTNTVGQTFSKDSS
jgi:phosphatidylglycerophosphate synthase